MKSRSSLRIFTMDPVASLPSLPFYEFYHCFDFVSYTGQLLKLRELLLSSHMAIYIDERTMADLAKTSEVGAEIERDDNEEEQEEQATYLDNAGSSSHPPTKKKVTVQNVRVKECLRLATVDNFQGEEAEVILISTVRCNTKGRVGFLKITNRVNVMMSRAKHGMYVFGSADTVLASNGDIV